MVVLETEGDELAGHVIPCGGGVPCFELVARVRSEVWGAGSGRGSVDGRQQHEVATRVRHLAAADGPRE